MNDIMKIVKALEDSNNLLKGVTKTIKNETKEQKGGFLSMLLGTSGASLLGDLLSGKGVISGEILRAGGRFLRAGERFLRAGEGFLTAGEGIRKISSNSTTSFSKF